MTIKEAIHILDPETTYGELCAYYGEKCEEAVDESLRMAMKALRALKYRWVSVEDALPPPLGKAICINRNGDMMIGTYTEWGWMFPCYFDNPTHWMPLPEPPEEG